MLFEKGFDNIVVLTGGIQEFFQKYPDLIDGDVPKEWFPKPPKKRVQTATSIRSTQKQVSTNKPATPSSVKVWK